MDINSDLFRTNCSFRRPNDMLKAVHTTNNRRKNKTLLNVIKSKLSDLKNEIEKMSDDEIETEKPDKIIDIVKKVLKFSRQNQEEKRLKILTPDQILSRLPISLAQIKAGNKSERLKN